VYYAEFIAFYHVRAVRPMHMRHLPGGWIYILLSSADYTRSKIGKTIQNPLIRFRQLRTGDPCLGLLVAYYIPEHLGPVSIFESSIHNELKDYRIKNHEESNSEWFRIDADQAEQQIDWMLEGWCEQKLSSPTEIYLEVLTKMYESDIQSLFEPNLHELEFARDVAGEL
jgi:hypothetical protein